MAVPNGILRMLRKAATMATTRPHGARSIRPQPAANAKRQPRAKEDHHPGKVNDGRAEPLRVNGAVSPRAMYPWTESAIQECIGNRQPQHSEHEREPSIDKP